MRPALRPLFCALVALALAAPAQPADPTGTASAGRPAVLLLGLDGADWDVLLPLAQGGHLPHLGPIALQGARGDLDCVPAMPETACYCPPVWVSVATGVPFARHRIAGMHDVASQRRARAVWSRLAQDGGSSTLVSYRNTWPPEPEARYVLTEYGLDHASRAYFDRSGDDPKKKTEGREAQAGRRSAPPDLLEQLGLLPHAGPRAPALAMLARDRLAMEALLRLARRDRTDLTAVLLHGPDKVEHLLWKQAQPSGDVPFDASVVLAQAETFEPAPRLGRGPQMTLASPYLEIDAWLGELLAEVHYDYVVLASDHGMAPNASEDGLAGVHGVAYPDAHRGVLALVGPGVRSGAVIQGASVLDLAPTLAWLLDLPVAEDQPGRVLTDAFDPDWLAAHPIRTTPTWQPESPRRKPRRR